MKTLRAWRAGMLLPLMLAALAVTAQTRTLNPTVRVLSQPTKPVPAECAQGLAPQPMPRVQVSELPPPVEKAAAVAPPSNTLRGQLAIVQETAQAGNRDAFREALARARATLGNYPAGAERDAAQAAVRVYSDLDRLWTYQFDSTTGAFFDDSTDLVGMMKTYPGWSAAMADQTLTAGGTRLYPTRESRDFLVREAARRVSRLGVGTAPTHATQRTPTTGTQTQSTTTQRDASMQKREPRTSTARREPGATSSSTRRPSTQRPSTQHASTQHASTPRASTPRASTTHASKQPPQSATRSSRSATPQRAAASTAGSMAAHQPPKTTHITTAPSVKAAKPPSAAAATPATGTHAPASKPAPSVASTSTHGASATSTASLSQAPATGTAPATTTASSSTTSSAPTATTATSSTASEPTTGSTDTASTTTTTATQATETVATSVPQPARGKNVIIPIILIIIGLGVLVVLFRASGQ